MIIELFFIDNDHPIRFAIILNQTIDDELFQLSQVKLTTPYIIYHHFDSKIKVEDMWNLLHDIHRSLSEQIFPNMTNNYTMDNLFYWVHREYVGDSIYDDYFRFSFFFVINRNVLMLVGLFQRIVTILEVHPWTKLVCSMLYLVMIIF